MLEVECQEHLDATREFAKSLGEGPAKSLEDNLSLLGDGQHWENSVCVLGEDFAPHSFAFCMYRVRTDGSRHFLFSGGCLFYAGSESGVGSPQFSVTLSGRTDSRWEIHT